MKTSLATGSIAERIIDLFMLVHYYSLDLSATRKQRFRAQLYEYSSLQILDQVTVQIQKLQSRNDLLETKPPKIRLKLNQLLDGGGDISSPGSLINIESQSQSDDILKRTIKTSDSISADSNITRESTVERERDGDRDREG